MLIELRKSAKFSTDKVNSLLPVIVKITKSYVSKVENKMLILDQIASSKEEVVKQIEGEIDQMLGEWRDKMKRLGAKPAGLWALDFDFGEGYYCWKYPEQKILYWHAYKEGFSNRKPISY